LDKIDNAKCQLYGTKPGESAKVQCRAQLGSVRTVINGQPVHALDRLSRYEATLWRQAGRILYALDVLDRRILQEKCAASMSSSNN